MTSLYFSIPARHLASVSAPDAQSTTPISKLTLHFRQSDEDVDAAASRLPASIWARLAPGAVVTLKFDQLARQGQQWQAVLGDRQLANQVGILAVDCGGKALNPAAVAELCALVAQQPCPQLALHLNRCELQDEGIEPLWLALRHNMPSQRLVLDLADNQLTDRTPQTLSTQWGQQQWPACRNVSLNLLYNRQVQAAAVAECVAVSGVFTQFECRYHFLQHGDYAMQAWYQALQSSSVAANLGFDFGVGGLSSDTLQKLEPVLKAQNPKIKSLSFNLAQCALGDDGMAELGKMVRSTQVQELSLDLTYNQLTKKAAATLRELANNRTLKSSLHLAVGQNSFGDPAEKGRLKDCAATSSRVRFSGL